MVAPPLGALLAGDDGLLGGALDGLGAGGGGVVGRDIEHVVCVARRAGDGDNIVRVGEGVCIHGAAGLLKRGLDDLDLVDGVRLAGAVDDADVLGVREQLRDHGRLLIERGQIGRAGDVAADRAGEVVDAERNAVLRDGRAEDRDVLRGGGRSLQRAGRVGKDQIHAAGHEAVADGGAGGRVAGGVLLVEGDVLGAERVGDRVAEALGGRIERVVLHELADADGVVLILGLVAVAAAGSQGQDHDHGAEQGSDFFDVHAFSPPKCSPGKEKSHTVVCAALSKPDREVSDGSGIFAAQTTITLAKVIVGICACKSLQTHVCGLLY